MAKNINTVITESQVIRDETTTDANTANRVGTNLVDLGENIQSLYNERGWGFYVDAETTPVTQTVGNTFTKLQIDGGAAETNEDYLPKSIRGSGSLWDTTNDKITPISIGDAYDVRVAFGISSESGNPTEIEMQVDIGGGASPTMVIAANYIKTGRSVPYFVSIALPIFTLDTFLANGAQIFLKTDTGSVEIAQRQILITRVYCGSL